MKLRCLLPLLFSFSGAFAQIYTNGIITGKDSCNLSNSCSIIELPSDSNNIWTAFNPQTKVLLTNGFNDSFALVTDTSRYYGVNASSSFTVYKNSGGDYNYTDGNFLLSFYHKLNTDSAHDGGFIEISYDNGQTWENVVLDQYNIENQGRRVPVFGLNMYTKEQLLANGQPGFSGDITEWTLVEVPITRFIPTKKANDVRLRFTFVSDSIADDKEGWIIDNVKLWEVYLPGGLNTLGKTPQVFTMSPNPCLDEVQLTALSHKLSGTVSVYSVEGKRLSVTTITDTTNTKINTQDFPAGMYSVIYRDEMGTAYFQKFVKAE